MDSSQYFSERHSPILIAYQLCAIREKELQEAAADKKKECWENLNEAIADLHRKISKAQENLYVDNFLGKSFCIGSIHERLGQTHDS